MGVVFGRKIPLSAWLSASAALAGTALVAGDGAAGVPPNIGDLLSIAAASASAMFILRLEAYAPFTDAKALTAVSQLGVFMLCLAWALVQAAVCASPAKMQEHSSGLVGYVSAEVGLGLLAWSILKHHLPVLLYLGVVITAFTSWLQTVGQQSVSATTAATIYALDPLWGCLFAYLWLGELLGPQAIIGCAILFSVWLYQMASAMWKQSSEIQKTEETQTTGETMNLDLEDASTDTASGSTVDSD